MFLGGITLFGSAFGAELAGDFALAYLLGLMFQYFVIVPMRGLSPGRGIVEAVKADTLSLLAFEVGLFGWMALMRFVLFDPPLRLDQASYWFMMQVGMAVGFLTSYPVNAWLVRRGIKEAMWPPRRSRTRDETFPRWRRRWWGRMRWHTHRRRRRTALHVPACRRRGR